MKKSVAKLILSWMVLIVGVTAVFLLRNHFGITPLEDAKPTITTVKTNKEGSVGIWWDCYNTTVTSYNIYKVKDGKQVFLASVPARTSHYWDAKAESGKPNVYTVKPLNSQSTSGRTGGQPSSQSQAIIPNRSKPIYNDITKVELKMLSAEEKEGKIQISWEPVYNVPINGYLILRREEGKDWEEIGKTSPSAQQYQDDSCKEGIRYEYEVRAYSGSAEMQQVSTCQEALSYTLGGDVS